VPSPSRRPRPAVRPQGRALYTGRGRAPQPPTHHAPPAHGPHHHQAKRAKVPSATSGLNIARRRVRETPWDSAYWTELADLLFKRGEFDLAARAYRRVQELCRYGPVARREVPPGSTPNVPWIGPGRQVVPPGLAPAAPVLAPATAPAASTPQHAAILRTESGQTRAIRLKDSRLVVAITLSSEESAPAPSPPKGTAPAAFQASGRPKGPALKPSADEKLRSVMQRDLENLLRTLEKDASPPRKGAAKEPPPSS
jgi:hypothetical protein